MNILKMIGKVLAMLLGVVIVLLSLTSIHYRFKVHNIMNRLKKNGYCNLVSAGDYKLNTLKVGNENGKHKIVCCSGLYDGTMNFSWRKMTKSIEEDNQLIFIDRAGYGFSEDTKTDCTVEQIVEDYRTVLKNMGEEGPYILLAHSISGLNVSYWQNKYPDEIESVIIMDGTLYIDEERGNYSNNRSRIFYAAEKVGLQSIIMKNVYGALADIDNMTGEELDMNVYMFSKTTGTHAIMSESNLIYQNAKNVIDNLKPNDIPKIYIDALNAFDENPEKKEKKWIPYEEKIGNCELVPLYGKHAIYMDRTEECAKIIKDHIDSLK